MGESSRSCTLVDAVGIRERGWDYVTYSSLGAALGAGKALKLSRHALRDIGELFPLLAIGE
jgi:2-methylcitrate dehydratase PrpD